MPVRNIYHDIVVRALAADGWTITDDPLWVVSVRLAQPLPILEGEVRRGTLASQASGILTDVWIETYRLAPILEREPGRDRGCLESRPCRVRHVTRAHRAPPSWVGPRSEVRVSKARK